MSQSAERPNQRGYSLMEVTVVLLVAVTVLLIVYGMLEEATKASLFVESHNELAQLAQLPVNRVQTEILQSRTVFVDDTIGNGYVTNMVASIATAWRPMTDTRLPIQVASTNSFAVDTGNGTARRVGNMLLIARQLPPLMIPYDHDTNVGTPNIPFPADRYRFQLYYLRQDTSSGFRTTMADGTFRRYGYILDLVEVQSGVYADYSQLNYVFTGTGALTAAQKTTIINGLTAAGITKAWNPGLSPVGTAFYSITSSGTLTAQPTHAIVIATTRSMVNLQQPGISGKMDFTVAMNPPSGGPNFRVPAAIPLYAVTDSSLVGFPGGLEFKVVGAGNSVKVLMRLLLLSNYGGSKMDAGEATVIAQAG